jgi:Helix-turn-helix domain
MADIGAGNPPNITYGPRGIGDLWPAARPAVPDGDPLAELLGRSRAAILHGPGLPQSTTKLARELDQSMAAVSAHLAVLRRAGLSPPGVPGAASSTNAPRTRPASSPPAKTRRHQSDELPDPAPT